MAFAAWLLAAYDQTAPAVIGSLIAAYLIRRFWAKRRAVPLWSPWLFVIALICLFIMVGGKLLIFGSSSKHETSATASCTRDYLPTGSSGSYGIFASAQAARGPLEEVCSQVDQRGGLDRHGYVQRRFALLFCGRLAGMDYDLRVKQGAKPVVVRATYISQTAANCQRAIKPH